LIADANYYLLVRSDQSKESRSGVQIKMW